MYSKHEEYAQIDHMYNTACEIPLVYLFIAKCADFGPYVLMQGQGQLVFARQTGRYSEGTADKACANGNCFKSIQYVLGILCMYITV